MPEIALEHRFSAHCESGVTSALLTHHGLPLSEALAFGIGSGLFFVQLPFDQLMGGPTTSFRGAPGSIFRKACKRLGVRWESRTFRDRDRATSELQALVDGGTPVGLQTSVYWLPYLPKRFRFPFNAHNIIAYGRKGDLWQISDPVLDQVVECPDEALRRARFAPGMLAPKGRLYYVAGPCAVDEQRLREAILEGVRETATRMTRIPIPYFGGKGIFMLARRMERWPRRLEPREALLQLSTVVRMQEEIGTGGAGFRYLEAAFLQEAGEKLGEPQWAGWAERLTEAGDLWRGFAAASARLCRSGQAGPGSFDEVAEMVRECGRRELALFEEIFAALRARPSPSKRALPPPSASSSPAAH